MELPEDIIAKIMCNLPFKSLIRFGCVSKRWFWLIITDQYVAKSHYRLATEQKSLTKRFLVIKVNDSDSSSSLHSDIPGLVDYSTRNLTLPLSKIRRILGFRRAFLFSWRAGCWKRIDSRRFWPDYPPVLLRERLHWFVPFIFKIITFNLADEKFSRIRLQPTNRFHHCACSSYGGSLYLTCFREGIDIQLWVMRKYDVQGSWTKLFRYKAPIRYPNEHIFVTAKATLLMADRDSTKMACIECKEDGQLVVDTVDMIERSCCAEMIIYEETLLSLRDCQENS